MSKATKNVEPDPVVPFIKEIQSVKFSPRFQIIVVNGILEMFVNTLIENKCKDGKNISDNSYFTYSIKLTLLHEVGLITEIDYKRLKAFKKLRDKAAHGTFTLPENWYEQFDGILYMRQPKTLEMVSIQMVLKFWFAHGECFRKVYVSFLPEKHFFQVGK